VILGETFMLWDDRATQDEFLLDSRPHLRGALSFFNGYGPRWRPRDGDPAGLLYHRNLNAFLSLRRRLVGADVVPTADRGRR